MFLFSSFSWWNFCGKDRVLAENPKWYMKMQTLKKRIKNISPSRCMYLKLFDHSVYPHHSCEWGRLNGKCAPYTGRHIQS